MRAKPDEKRGLEKLFKLSVLGAVIIVVVYSVYYYSNAYRQMSSKLIDSTDESTIIQLVANSKDTFEGANSVYSPMPACALREVGNYKLSDFDLLPSATCEKDVMFSNVYVTVSGATKNGVVDQMFESITQKFGTAPPRQMKSKAQDFVCYGVHYQNYMLSDNVLINWQNQDTVSYPFKRHAYFLTDSVKDQYRLVESDQGRILRFERPEHNDHCFLAEWNDGWSQYSIQELNDKVLPGKVFGQPAATGMGVRFPLMDFQWNHEFDADGAKARSEETGETHDITYAGFELKGLLGPNLKTPNAYEVDLTGVTFTDFKPPLLVIMSKDNSPVPYLAVLIKDHALIID